MALVWIVGTVPAAAAPAFRSNPALFRQETAHFTFIYPAAARPAADEAAGLAEELYTEVTGRLGVDPKLKIPVVITPETDDLNGYFTPYPSIRIVLYQAPLSPNSGFAYYRQTLRKLLLHELTHAVSLMQTDLWGTFLGAAFGDLARPGETATPGLFIEGVTVSYESRDGFGRANDAASWEVLQQAALEDRWPTPTEASGAWDGYPRGIIYQWGGLFSRYLQETYGDEAYGALFRSFGRGETLNDVLWFPGAFRRAFGLGLDEAWEAFRRWVLVQIPLRVDALALDDGPTTITATASRGDAVYWADFRGVWERRDGRNRFLTEEGRSAGRLSVSADGRFLLISRIDYQGDLGVARLVEWNLASGGRTGRSFPDHLFEAAYDGDAVLACRPAGYSADLVRVTGRRVEVLVPGREGFTPAQPFRMDDGRLLFLLQRDGLQRLAFRDSDGGLKIVEAPGIEGIRQIFSDGAGVWFAWDPGRTFLQLGVYRDGRVTVYPPTAGGVHHPVPGTAGVYAMALSGRGHRFVLLPRQEGRTVDAPLADVAPPAETPAAGPPPSQPYEPWLEAWWPGTRVPLPLVNPHSTGAADLLWGAGLTSWSSDPTGTVAVTSQIGWIAPRQFAPWSLQADSYLGPVDWQLSVFDQLVPDRRSGGDVRQTGTTAAVGWPGEGLRDHWGLGAAVGAFQAAQPTGTGVEEAGRASASYRSFHPVGLEGEQWGFSVEGVWSGVLPAGRLRPESLVQGSLRLALPFLKPSAGLTGVRAVTGDLSLGLEGPRPADGRLWLGLGAVPGLPTASSALTSDWLAQGDLSAGVSLPIRRSLPGIGYAGALDLQTGLSAAWITGGYADDWFTVAALNFRYDGIPAAVGLPLGAGLRIDVPVTRPGAPVLSLYIGQALY